MIVMFWIALSKPMLDVCKLRWRKSQPMHAGIDFNPGVFQWVVEFGAPVELLPLDAGRARGRACLIESSLGVCGPSERGQERQCQTLGARRPPR